MPFNAAAREVEYRIPRKFRNNLYHRRMATPRVVILGCGFGGLWAAQALRKAPLELTVVDRTNHHLFTPLLYQVATAGLAAPEISGPIRHILAGPLAEIARHTLRGEFRHFDPRNARVVLVEGTDRVLPLYPPELSEKARLQLERLGVTVWLGRRVTEVDAGGVTLGHDRIGAKTVIWAAGVASSPLARALGAPLERNGQVKVEPDLSVPGLPEVFVVGDLAAVDAVPGIAPAAKQMGRHAARNVLAQLKGKPTKPFRYRDYGQLATIGRNAAVAMIGRLHLSGFPAWLVWLVAHIYFLINFRNRIMVMFDLTWAYWTSQRYARIVFLKPPASPR